MFVLDREKMQQADNITINDYGVPSIVLMENAALSVLNVIENEFRKINKIAILCGKGNNGGDGLALARHLYNRNYEVQIYLFSKPNELKGDPKINYNICKKMGIPVKNVVNEKNFLEVFPELFEFPLIVDALFGTGLSKPLEGFWENVINAVNSIPSTKVSIDIPSGLDSSTSKVIGPAIIADLTVTFGAYKIAHIFPPSSNYCGKVIMCDIGIPKELLFDLAKIFLTRKGFIASILPKRKPDSHKGNFGHILIIAGSKEKPGALSMAALGALRCGAGLVTCASVEDALKVLHNHTYEAMGLILDKTPSGTIALSSIHKVLKASEDKDAIVLGPGLSQEEETQEFIRRVVLGTSTPLVLDADGLNAFSKKLEILKGRQGETVLTPHPGELSRLINITTEEILKDRLKYVEEAAKISNSCVVLKGHMSLTAQKDGKIWVNLTGNPGMATGGMGDVLSGMIGAFLGQKIKTELAAVLGVYLHGLAGDLAAKKKGEEALIPRDLIEEIPLAFEYLYKDE